MHALEHLRRAKAFSNEHQDAYLLSETERIERLVRQQRIKAEEGVFMIRSSFLPTWREAHEMLGKFLLAEALRHAGDNQTKAAELLGVTKAYITMLRKKYGM
jgi:transcriptional regulator with GAF, ATPase, and Fis domain